MSRQMTLQDGDYFQLPWGRLEFHNNELHVVTEVNDPAGMSYRGANGCKQSWKDADGREKVLVQFRENGDDNGEVYIGCLSKSVLDATGNLDRAMIELITINPAGIEFRAPVKFSAGVQGVCVCGGGGDTTWSPDGHWFTQQQNDGNLVKYHTAKPFDKQQVDQGGVLVA